MDFQKIKKIENADFYLDYAFKKANEKAEKSRDKTFKKRIEKSRYIELEKLNVIKDKLVNNFTQITDDFPDFDNMGEFYNELLKLMLNKKTVKKSLGAISWASLQIKKLNRMFTAKVKGADDIETINNARKSYYGRISSVIKQISKEIDYLEVTRKVLRKFPVIREEAIVVCIAGFPNVGKSTLLGKLTDAKPEINKYAFTTKSLNLGMTKIKYREVQFIDTPGTLNRLDKMNDIEQIAHIAMKYAGNIILYLFDVSESSYPLKDQKKLLKQLKELDKPIIAYITKQDITDEDDLEEFKNEFDKKKIPLILDIEELKNKIVEIDKNE